MQRGLRTAYTPCPTPRAEHIRIQALYSTIYSLYSIQRYSPSLCDPILDRASFFVDRSPSPSWGGSPQHDGDGKSDQSDYTCDMIPRDRSSSHLQAVSMALLSSLHLSAQWVVGQASHALVGESRGCGRGVHRVVRAAWLGYRDVEAYATGPGWAAATERTPHQEEHAHAHQRRAGAQRGTQ